MSKQTQNTMLMVGAMAGTVGLVAFVALMVLGEYAFSPALFLAILVAAVAGIFLVLGFHRKPVDQSPPQTRAQAPSAPAPVAEPAPSAAVAEPHAAPAPSASSVNEPAAVASAPASVESDAAPSEGTRPEALSAARDGKADDLKMIKGVGPKLEELCNSLGFYHFDQIANWSADEVAWVDQNLEGFKGRVTRDDWVAQAKVLAEGGDTEFSKKVEDGNV